MRNALPLEVYFFKPRLRRASTFPRFASRQRLPASNACELLTRLGLPRPLLYFVYLPIFSEAHHAEYCPVWNAFPYVVTVEGIIWRLDNGAKWHSIPAKLGNWHHAYLRFRRRAVSGVWRPLSGAARVGGFTGIPHITEAGSIASR
jgi:hypothetical protein